jgi:hypothetical protein
LRVRCASLQQNVQDDRWKRTDNPL